VSAASGAAPTPDLRAPDPAAKARYLAALKDAADEQARMAGADIRVFAPEPEITFHACGRTWPLVNARNVVGLKRFVEIARAHAEIAQLDDISEVERDWRWLRLLVPDLPEEAFTEHHLTRNQLRELVRVGFEVSGRPQPGEGVRSSGSGTSSPSTAAGTPATATKS